jgi:hypothetical protein
MYSAVLRRFTCQWIQICTTIFINYKLIVLYQQLRVIMEAESKKIRKNVQTEREICSYAFNSECKG